MNTAMMIAIAIKVAIMLLGSMTYLFPLFCLA